MLVAMLIMAVGVLATLSMISASMDANSHANKLTTKTALAQQMMEDLLSRDKNTLDVPATNVVYNLNLTGTNNDLVTTAGAGAGTYHATYSTAWSPTPNLVLITIEISSVPADPRSLPLTAYAYRCLE